MGITDFLYSFTFLHGLFGLLLGVYIRILGKTCQFQIYGQENYDKAVECGMPIFFVLWHQQLMPVVAFGWKKLKLEKFVALVEGGNRGKILSTLARSLNAYRTVQIDMQGNSLAAGRKLLEIIQLMQDGKYTLLTPDGPYGPPFIPKPGAVFIARKAKAVIAPCGAWSNHALTINRWDRYLIPLPFSHIVLVFSELINPESFEYCNSSIEERLTKEMHSARNKAKELTK